MSALPTKADIRLAVQKCPLSAIAVIGAELPDQEVCLALVSMV